MRSTSWRVTEYKRGTVVLADFDPVVGSEQGRTRPCIVVSDLMTVRASRSLTLYTVVPLTTSQTLVGSLAPRISARKDGLPRDSVALVVHVRSIDPARIKKRVCSLNSDELRLVLDALLTHFGVDREQ